MTAPIDRRALVARHGIRLEAPHPEHVLSVGNGDFAFTTDITGMQTFTAFHHPGLAAREQRVAIATSTMSTWGWHEMPTDIAYTLDDVMTEYETARGTVRYPDRFDMDAGMRGQASADNAAGTWLNNNPHRLDLGRVGLELRETPDGEPLSDPTELTTILQEQDLWSGEIDSRFEWCGMPVHVRTIGDPEDGVVAFRIESPLLADGRARLTITFPYASDTFFLTADWTTPDAHTSELRHEGNTALIDRRLDDTRYEVAIALTDGKVRAADAPHRFVVDGAGSVVEAVVRFAPQADDSLLPTFAQVRERAIAAGESFWMSGAALELDGDSDPRAAELERRVVLSQHLTRVHCSGVQPPQETGLVVNSWQGKFHLEMHYWHAAHFAAWGRPELLERSLDWYLDALPVAKATAARQLYPGARWPKSVGPDGRESPNPIGPLLAWQQPHVLHMLELAHAALPNAQREALVAKYAELVDQTAQFMAAFPEERDHAMHLGPPIMPAQEFYDARSTTDPTFELAYWWFGLEIAQRWRERLGSSRRAEWTRVQDSLAAPHQIDGRYAAVRTDEPMRLDDHPSMLMALGVVPPTPLIVPEVMDRTLDFVLDSWDWDSAWGWDFPVMAMTASRLGRGDAVDILLREAVKNRCTVVGHNPQLGTYVPLYLPGNGGTLLATALMIETDSLPADWTVRAEGFVALPR